MDRISRPLASLALLISLALTGAPAEAQDRTGAPIVEDFITELERKAIDRYMERRGLKNDERSEILDPRTNPEVGHRGKSSHKHAGKGRGKGKHKGLPPGLAKRGGNLPPGLAKRSQLPPGLAKRQLPDDLQVLLPTRAPGTELVEVDGNVVLVDLVTDKVLDIIEGAIVGTAQ